MTRALEMHSRAGPEQSSLPLSTWPPMSAEHKTGEGIGYMYDRDRQGFQKFIGVSNALGSSNRRYAHARG